SPSLTPTPTNTQSPLLTETPTISPSQTPTQVATVSPSPTVTATPTPTPTLTTTPSPTSSRTTTLTATATATGSTIGGRGFGVSPGNGGVRLSWQSGVGQTGYAVVRLTDGGLALLGLPGLGPSATTFVDTTAQPGVDCYFLVLLGPSPQLL